MLSGGQVKTFLTRVLIWVGMWVYRLRLHPLIIWLHRKQPKVLIYHACEKDESDFLKGLKCNCSPAQFASHLDFLSRYYRFISLTELENGVTANRAVALTFDDGYRSVYENAFPMLRERAIPATTFLVTDAVGNRNHVWINKLNWLLRNHESIARPIATKALQMPLGAAVESIIHKARVHYDVDTLQQVFAKIRRHPGVGENAYPGAPRLYLNWDEVQEMSAHGFSFGNHTASHPNLARLDESRQRDEIARGHQALIEHLGECRTFAYPFGDHDDVSRRLASELGHTMILKVGGTNNPLDVERVARISVRASDAAALFAEMEVVAPVEAFFKRPFWLGAWG